MPSISSVTSSPLIFNYAVDASQKAIKPVARYLSPNCEVPDLTFRYKQYNAVSRYRRPSTLRDINGRATRLGFTAQDQALTLQPHALDFPIPNLAGMSQQVLEHSVQYGITLLADASALDAEAEIINDAVAATATLASPNGGVGLAALVGGTYSYQDFTNASVDPVATLDEALLTIMRAARNGAPVKILFGTNAFRNFRNNPNVTKRFVVGNRGAGGGGSVGTIAPSIADASALLMTNPEVQMSMMVIDETVGEGLAPNIQFLLDNDIFVFASNDTPNTMDPSFMKTFVPMGGFFRPGSYLSEDERDQVLKMDWTMQPAVTNTIAALRIRALPAGS